MTKNILTNLVAITSCKKKERKNRTFDFQFDSQKLKKKQNTHNQDTFRSFFGWKRPFIPSCFHTIVRRYQGCYNILVHIHFSIWWHLHWQWHNVLFGNSLESLSMVTFWHTLLQFEQHRKILLCWNCLIPRCPFR